MSEYKKGKYPSIVADRVKRPISSGGRAVRRRCCGLHNIPDAAVPDSDLPGQLFTRDSVEKSKLLELIMQ